MKDQSAPRQGLQAATVLLITPLALLALLPLTSARAAAQSLAGSRESMLRQNLVAQQHDYSYLRNTQEVLTAVNSGVLVAVHGNEDLQLAGGEVSFPYARPEVKIFLEQLAHAYHATCGEQLVVTSLTRPISRQPWNASPISVHPTGMAVDMRHSDRRACRQWMDSTLLALEGEGMIEATRERWPAHYHVAVFPDPLLLPGPIGDPNGVTRLAALHHGTPQTAQEISEDEPSARPGRVHIARSARTGRLRITQTGHGTIARRSGGSTRIVVHRSRRHPGAGTRQAGNAAGRSATRAASRSAVAKHRSPLARHRSRSATATRTSTAK
jgi:hypothetical protein